MRKPVLGGVVSGLVLAMGVTGPSDRDGAETARHATGDREHAPQVLFDPDTGRMTIVSDELREAVRVHLEIASGEGDGWLAAEGHDVVNIGC